MAQLMGVQILIEMEGDRVQRSGEGSGESGWQAMGSLLGSLICRATAHWLIPYISPTSKGNRCKDFWGSPSLPTSSMYLVMATSRWAHSDHGITCALAGPVYPSLAQNTRLNTSVLLPTHSLKEEELESPVTSWVVRTFTNVVWFHSLSNSKK